jgi:hypothetical protein
VPASICMACSSVEGASTLSEVRVVGLYQYIFMSSFPKKDDVSNVPVATSTKQACSANFGELRKAEVRLRRIHLPCTPVNENVPGLSAPLSVAVSLKAQEVRLGLDHPIVVLLGGFEEIPSRCRRQRTCRPGGAGSLCVGPTPLHSSQAPAMIACSELLFQGELAWPLRFAISRRRIASHAVMTALNHAPPAANPPTTSLT